MISITLPDTSGKTVQADKRIFETRGYTLWNQTEQPCRPTKVWLKSNSKRCETPTGDVERGSTEFSCTDQSKWRFSFSQQLLPTMFYGDAAFSRRPLCFFFFQRHRILIKTSGAVSENLIALTMFVSVQKSWIFLTASYGHTTWTNHGASYLEECRAAFEI